MSLIHLIRFKDFCREFGPHFTVLCSLSRHLALEPDHDFAMSHGIETMMLLWISLYIPVFFPVFVDTWKQSHQCCSLSFWTQQELGLMSAAEFLWVSGEWGQALRSVGCVGRARHGNMYNHADERDWAAVIEPHLSCGWKCCFGLNLDFKNAVKNRATEKKAMWS